jgi:hypothetical protein
MSKPKEYTSQLFQCTEDMIMDPHNDILHLDHFSDDEDGTFPNVMSYQKLAKAIDDEGSVAWLKWATVKTSVENREYKGDGFTLHWKADEELCKIEFDKPTPFLFARIGTHEVIHDVNVIEGMVTVDAYWMKNPRRQSKWPNGYDVTFNIYSFLA